MSQFNDVENSVSSFDLAQVVTQQMSSNDTINNNNTQEYMADILVGILHEDLNDFLSDFWRVASLEDEAEYLAQLEAMKASWSNVVDYLTVLEAKQNKWAFAYTHQYFVAGMASTQRQESVNFQVKANLINNSTLTHLLMGFESFENRAALRMVKASLSTKLSTLSADQMIDGALKVLTDYAGTLLQEESALSFVIFM
jgi:hypothetical protein